MVEILVRGKKITTWTREHTLVTSILMPIRRNGRGKVVLCVRLLRGGQSG